MSSGAFRLLRPETVVSFAPPSVHPVSAPTTPRVAPTLRPAPKLQSGTTARNKFVPFEQRHPPPINDPSPPSVPSPHRHIVATSPHRKAPGLPYSPFVGSSAARPPPPPPQVAFEALRRENLKMRKQIAALRHAEVEAADSRPPPDLDYPFAVGRTSISDAPALAGLVRQNQALLEEVRQLRDVVGELQERSGSDGMPSAPPPAPTEAPASPRTRRGLSAYQRQYDQVQELQAELARVYEQVREQHAELALSHSRSSAQTDETKQLKVASHLLKARAHASLVRVRTTEEQRNTLAEQLEFKRVEDAWQEATLRTALREVEAAEDDAQLRVLEMGRMREHVARMREEVRDVRELQADMEAFAARVRKEANDEVCKRAKRSILGVEKVLKEMQERYQVYWAVHVIIKAWHASRTAKAEKEKQKLQEAVDRANATAALAARAATVSQEIDTMRLQEEAEKMKIKDAELETRKRDMVKNQFMANTAKAQRKMDQERQATCMKLKSELMVRNQDGHQVPFDVELLSLFGLDGDARSGVVSHLDQHLTSAKWSGNDVNSLILGDPSSSALGLANLLRVDLFELFGQLQRGVDAIVDEFSRAGSSHDKECLDYVLNKRAGASHTQFKNSPFPRDCDADGLRDDRKTPSGDGMALADFVAHPSSRLAQLTPAHVLAIRLYSTAAFHSLNGPLRDRERTTPHQFAATVFFLADGIKKLRALEADKMQKGSTTHRSRDSGEGSDAVDLWRGMKNVRAMDEFQKKGGTEPAMMSTTSSLSIAVTYGLSAKSLLFKIKSKSFMSRGADISFLSCFPSEAEFLYPPLTYLRPTGRSATCTFTPEQLGVQQHFPLGISWTDVGESPPEGCEELDARTLALALKNTTDFTKVNLENHLDGRTLAPHHYVRSGNSYFQPSQDLRLSFSVIEVEPQFA